MNKNICQVCFDNVFKTASFFNNSIMHNCSYETKNFISYFMIISKTNTYEKVEYNSTTYANRIAHKKYIDETILTSYFHILNDDIITAEVAWSFKFTKTIYINKINANMAIFDLSRISTEDYSIGELYNIIKKYD